MEEAATCRTAPKTFSTRISLATRLIGVGALALCLVGPAQGTPSGRARVLVDDKGSISWQLHSPPDFGVNGTRLRWYEETASKSRFRTLDIDASTSSVIGRWPAGMAFSAGRTASRGESGGHVRYNSVGVCKGRRCARLEEFETPDEGPGGYLAAPYALGPYIAYSWYETGRRIKGSCAPDGFACDYAVERGGLRLIDGMTRGRLVTDVPVAAFTLSNTGAVAYVRATTRWHNDRGPSVIEVITLWSPHVLQRIDAPGKVTDLAVSDRVLAVKTLLGSSNRTSVVFFDLWTGRRLRTLRFRNDTVYWLALKASTAVLPMGRNLVAVQTRTGHTRVLHRARGRGAHAPAFAGDELVWYEQYGSDAKPRYRVMSMSV
jgi:hypothetical protein